MQNILSRSAMLERDLGMAASSVSQAGYRPTLLTESLGFHHRVTYGLWFLPRDTYA